MRVLIGCEESGKVRRSFRKRGHDAWSNDLIPARDESQYHLQKCVKRAIVEDGPWDIIILHYECTEMAVCANRWYAQGKPGWPKRQDALAWAEDLWNLAKKHARIGCAFENPASTLWTRIGTPQYIHPWQFGHKETKKTGIKLDRLPPLLPTKVVGPPLRLVRQRENHGSVFGAWQKAPQENVIVQKLMMALQKLLRSSGVVLTRKYNI